MKVALLGRTKWLLETAKLLINSGFNIALIATAKEAEFYDYTRENFEELAKSINCSFYSTANIFQQETIINEIRKADIDVAFSVNWPNILDEVAISCFKHGILNAHAGDLPRYRGNACPNWAILNNEEKIALSIHKMEARKLDSGPIYCKEYFMLHEHTYITEVYEWLDDIIPKNFLKAAHSIHQNKFQVTPQSTNNADALHCFPRKPEDSRINWKNSATEIYKLIRASSRPFLGAFCYTEGNLKTIIWKAKPFIYPTNFLAVPGQIIGVFDDRVVISCGNNEALILEDFIVENQENYIDSKKTLLSSMRNRLI